MNKYKRWAGMLAVLLILIMCSGCALNRESTAEEQSQEGQEASGKETEVKKTEAQNINDVHLRDKDSLYENDDDTSVVTMYLTVSRGNSSENTDHSWKEINSYSAYDYVKMGVARYEAAALLQIGDENGPVQGEVGYGETIPNATVKIRGQTSSTYPQKNYKIELKKNKGTWRGQRTINLNKHMGEGLRFRNKMAYDMLKKIPQMLSLRTQFVHLYVKDCTDVDSDSFEDYGLYTQVEQLNKTGMKNHGLDSNGQLYKINYFEFYRYEDVIKKEDDPDYDKVQFENYLEIKGNSDHSKLIAMLEELNDYSVSIDTVLSDHFDVENLTYWMAFQILTGNSDTQNRNTYLYSPLNSDTWYFISWDNDGALMKTENSLKDYSDQSSWECGVSNYWGNVLFQRCLKSDTFREELDRAVEDLKDKFAHDTVEKMVQSYVAVVKPYVYAMPDAMNAPLTSEQYDQVATAIPDEIEQNYEAYKESLKKPMPFYIGVPSVENDKLKLNWDVSYDFDAEEITYSVDVASDYQFQNVIYSSYGQTMPEAEMDIPEAGQYFVRVKATNAAGYMQDAFDYYVTNDGKSYGMKCFYVTEDDQIEEEVYEEQ